MNNPTLDGVRTRLEARLPGAARAWLDQALDEAAAHPGAEGPVSVWELRLAEAGRRCGDEHADAARVLILAAAHADPPALRRVYGRGTAAERRAVLHALPHLVPGPDALPLVEDALRTNDTRLVAAAVGPYAARHLDAHGWR
ncbi:EboA domain-containing protein, partial [Streptomyces sp. NPDC006610]|uniref:EboA domain-containing protein n=1 Tax=Streptomyces sp. NPDC006610 TaxID=3154584 RepID=UPI0033ACFFB6